jgi:hypothetical protein
MLTVLALLAASCCGCTTVTLETYTLSQIRSSGDSRGREVLSCLATVAANPDTLPSFAIYGDGFTRIQDQATVGSTTTWTRALGSFAMETLGFTLTRNPSGQWTIDSVMEFERLEAMRCACIWALYGPERAYQAHPEILSDPLRENLNPNEPHFGVEDRLSRIPPGWIHVGKLKDVPLHACYKAHCGNTWVWVMPEASEAFAQFTLVLHDIATLDYSVLYSPRLLVWLTVDDVTQMRDLSDPTKGQPISTTEQRMVLPEYRKQIEAAIRNAMRTNGKVDLTWAQWMTYTAPYHGNRITTAAASGVVLGGATGQGIQLGPIAPTLQTRPLPPPPPMMWKLQ